MMSVTLQLLETAAFLRYRDQWHSLLAASVTLSRWMAPISQLRTGTVIQNLLIILTLLVQSAAVVCANSKVCVSSVCKTWKHVTQKNGRGALKCVLLQVVHATFRAGDRYLNIGVVSQLSELCSQCVS